MIKCIGCIIYDQSKNMFLLQQRSKNTTYPLKWGLWGGKLNQGEDFIAAMRRELEEELGAVPNIVELKPLDVFVANDGHFVYYSFILVTDNFEVVTISDTETNDFVWLPAEHVLKIDLHPATRKTLTKKIHLLNKVNH